MERYYHGLIVSLALICLTLIIFIVIKAIVDAKTGKPLGIIYVIDDTDDGPQLFLEITGCSVDYLRKKKTIRLNIIDKSPRYIQPPI